MNLLPNTSIRIPTAIIRTGLMLFVALSFAGCESLQSTATDPEVAADTAVSEAATEVLTETVFEEAVTEEAQEPAWEYDISQLLREADEALAADRLTTPIEDNAFDRYSAVLILQPDNQAAIDGLQEIFSRYVLLAQDAMRTGELGKARALIERARAVISDAPTLDTLLQDLAQKQRERARSQPQVEIDPNQKEIALSVDRLNRRDETIVEQLQSLAMQVRESDETLLIVARSDSEGRWIYQQMAETVPGYRIRGDIRLGRIPKVLLLPPIE